MIQKEETSRTRSVIVKIYVVSKPWCLPLLAIGQPELCAQVSQGEDQEGTSQQDRQRPDLAMEAAVWET